MVGHKEGKMKYEHKAVIDPDGKYVVFMIFGHEWQAWPSMGGKWCVQNPDGVHGYGKTIPLAIKDAEYKIRADEACL
jgi:hypothetical protein